MLATINYCTTLCHTMLNCILSCCQVQVLMKQWQFDAIKEHFSAEGHCPSLLFFKTKKWPILSHFPWGGSLILLSPLSCIYHLSLLSLTPTLFFLSSLWLASSRLLSCENDVIWIWWQRDIFCKLSLQQHFSLRLHVKSHLICQEWQSQCPSCNHNSTLKYLKLIITYWLVELAGALHSLGESATQKAQVRTNLLYRIFFCWESASKCSHMQPPKGWEGGRNDGKPISMSVPPGICIHARIHTDSTNPCVTWES